LVNLKSAAGLTVAKLANTEAGCVNEAFAKVLSVGESLAETGNATDAEIAVVASKARNFFIFKPPNIGFYKQEKR
jgi:hypothetical protein